ncbi:hypothetical protein [Streptomyces sp. NPDC091416]|uniref:hypothetical protein n=1 Tax=Streptomyces sp. NPDC091416 TaxID=3366003 RepID=UPI0038306AA7
MRAAASDEGQQGDPRGGAGEENGWQHAGLAEPVDQPGELRPAQGLGHGESAGHESGRGGADSITEQRSLEGSG